MEPTVAGLVLMAAVMHAGWNTLVKVGGEPAIRLAITNGFSALVVLPLIFFLELPAPESWPYLLASLGVHIFYYSFLSMSYRAADLSLIYPIARGAAPPFVAIGAFLLAGETLSFLGIASIGIISMAICMLALHPSILRTSGKAVIYAFVTALSIATYTVIDGTGARLSDNALSYVSWLFVIDGVGFVAIIFVLKRGALKSQLVENWKQGITSGVLHVGSYGLVVWAMVMTPMTYVSALRETSVIIAALIGAKFLKEPFGARRIVSACLIVLGIVLLQKSGLP